MLSPPRLHASWGGFHAGASGGLRPRRDRAAKGVTGRESACKTMHPVDAWLNSGKIAVFSGIFAGATCRPVPCAGGHKSGSVRGGIFPDYHSRSRDRPESDGC